MPLENWDSEGISLVCLLTCNLRIWPHRKAKSTWIPSAISLEPESCWISITTGSYFKNKVQGLWYFLSKQFPEHSFFPPSVEWLFWQLWFWNINFENVYFTTSVLRLILFPFVCGLHGNNSGFWKQWCSLKVCTVSSEYTCSSVLSCSSVMLALNLKTLIGEC